MNRASRYFARSPRQDAESGSLSLCSNNFLWLPSDPAVGQRRPCHSNSLPHEQGEVTDKQRLGLPASLGKQKTAARENVRPLKMVEGGFEPPTCGL